MTDREAEAARRLSRFLADEHVVEAFEVLRRRAYDDFKAADTPLKREEAWTLSRGIDEVERELRAIVERGEVAGALQ